VARLLAANAAADAFTTAPRPFPDTLGDVPLQFHELDVRGAFTISSEPFVDDRGAFARLFCTEEFAAQGLETRVEQCSASLNRHRGTLRGMHLQLAPFEETKVVRCTQGAVWDAIVDLRPESATFGVWTGVELRLDAPTALYVPRGVAHGFITLEDDTRVEYMISARYAPGSAVGVRWDDPAIGIVWPELPTVMSDRDRALPDLDLDRIRAAGLVAALTLG
jgi:dTDP-4-dehydrorhamnose 3,5-epimerase